MPVIFMTLKDIKHALNILGEDNKGDRIIRKEEEAGTCRIPPDRGGVFFPKTSWRTRLILFLQE